jgi:hypothetical protein
MSVRTLQIKLEKDEHGSYRILAPRFRPISADTKDQVQWIFVVEFPNAEHPSPAKAEIIFERSPFIGDFSGSFTIWENAPYVTQFIRDDAVGAEADAEESYKYTVIVTPPDGAEIRLPPLDPSVMVRRRRMRPSEV